MNSTDSIRKNNVTISGDPDAKQTMIFGHGFGTDQTIWSEVAKHFERDFRIIRYDNVGAGGSDQASFNPLIYSDIHAFANDLLDICAALEIENAIMVGHSASAMVAVLAANARPQTFSRLVLVGASPCYRNVGTYYGGFEQTDLDALYTTMQTNYHAWVSGFAPLAMANPDRPQLISDFAASLRTIRADIALAVMRAIIESDHRRDVAILSQPVLIIQSREDLFVPQEVGEFLQRTIPNSRLVVVDSTGHFPHVSATEQVIAAMRAFLSE